MLYDYQLRLIKMWYTYVSNVGTLVNIKSHCNKLHNHAGDINRFDSVLGQQWTFWWKRLIKSNRQNIAMYTQGHMEGVSRGFLKSLKFLQALLKLETQLWILLYKYWNKNHCRNATLPLFVENIRYNRILRVGLSPSKRLILCDIKVILIEQSPLMIVWILTWPLSNMPT